MSTGWIVLIVVLVILIGVLVGLYFFGKKSREEAGSTAEQMDAMAQTVNMLIIDKKKMKLKEANLPSAVLENTPKYLRRTKVPVVKAKVGPRVMTLMCDAKIFDLIPIKKEVKATVSGIYITAVKGVRGPLEAPEKAKKKGFFCKIQKRQQIRTKSIAGRKSALQCSFLYSNPAAFGYNIHSDLTIRKRFMIHIQFIIHPYFNRFIRNFNFHISGIQSYQHLTI